MTRFEARRTVVQVLYSWDINPSVKLIDIPVDWIEYEENDSGYLFSKMILTGISENIDLIDKTIEKHLKNWTLKRLARVDLSILRLGVYSLLFQKEIPLNVTINEAVNLAKEMGSDDSFKFINGVLDGINRA